MVLRRGQKRRITALGLGLALMAGLLAVLASSASATHDLAFQLDGNTAVGTATNFGGNSQANDWETFFKRGVPDPPGDIALCGTKAAPVSCGTGNPVTGFIAAGKSVDYALPDATTFATGSKDTLNIAPNPKSGWQCSSSNNLGAKDDLVNVYTAAYRNPVADANGNHHLIVYFGAEKSSNLGDNNIGIWFLQDPTVGCTAGKGATDFTGQHVPGDVLLTAAFTNGGGTATVQAFTWIAGSGNGGVGSLSTPTTGFLCDGASTLNDVACAITNDATNQSNADGTINPPWNHPVKTAGTNGGLAAEEFYEGGVDVTQLEINATQNLQANPCISTFVADTRSSQSPTATIFDFALGSLPACNPSTTMLSTTATASPATVHSGESSTFSFYETNNGNTVLTSPHLTTDNSGGCLTPSLVTGVAGGDANNNGVFDPGETWKFTCTVTATTSDLTVTATGHGTDPLGRDVTVCTTSDSGHLCIANEQTSASVKVIHPNTDLTSKAATAVPSTIHSGDSTTLTFWEKNSGTEILTSPAVTTDDLGGCATTTQKTSGGFNVGDSNADGNFDPGETWAFQCTTTITAAAGDTVVTAIGDALDSLGAHVTFSTTYPNEKTTVTVTVIAPSTLLRESASAAITYTFNETNDGTSAPLTSPYISVPAGQCDNTPAQKVSGGFNVGDSNGNGILDSGETWVWTCTHTLNGPDASVTGSTNETNTGTGHGTDATKTDITYPGDAGERDSVTVTITNN